MVPVSGGLFHHTWLAESPPPSPNTNLSINYNYTDNPDRRFAPGGDEQVTVAWDNLSETSPDPKTGWFDFRGYKIWKVSNWARPKGSGGPSEDDWTLLAEYRLFDLKRTNGHVCPPESAAVCTPAEQRQLYTVAAAQRQGLLSLIFSAKESVFKAIFPATRHFIDFAEVTIDVNLTNHRFTARAVDAGTPAELLASMQGRFHLGAELVMTTAVLPSP